VNAIEQLYRNAGLVTEDGYVKVRDGLWIASGPYQEQSWNKADKSTLPTKEELKEIRPKLQDLILIQESCGLPSVRQILEEDHHWVWSSTEYNADFACVQRMSDGFQSNSIKNYANWVIPIRRSP